METSFLEQPHIASHMPEHPGDDIEKVTLDLLRVIPEEWRAKMYRLINFRQLHHCDPVARARILGSLRTQTGQFTSVSVPNQIGASDIFSTYVGA